MRYDTTLKALLEQPPETLLRLLLGEKVRVSRMLPTELPLIQGSRPDLILELEDGRIVHIELQAQPDQGFTTRMLRYWERLYVKYDRAPVQIVLWVGKGKVAVESGLRARGLHFRYRVLDLKSVDTTRLLRSRLVDENLLGLLGDVRNRRLSVRRVLHRIAELPVENQQKDAIQKLMILSGLRGIEPLVIEEKNAMPITVHYDENLFLKRAFEKGIEKGVEKGVEVGELRATRELVLRLLEKRFSRIPAGVRTRVRKADLASLRAMSEKIVDASSVDDIL